MKIKTALVSVYDKEGVENTRLRFKDGIEVYE